MNMTPQLISVLTEAAEEAQRRGFKTLGVEDVFLTVTGRPDTIPTQILGLLGLTEALRAKLEEIMTSEAYLGGSNKCVDSEGRLLGYMFLDQDGNPYVGDERGNPIHLPN